jgi:hypothetical protein
MKEGKDVTIVGYYEDGTHAPARSCPYHGCPQCGGCGVCGDFHGNAYGGCVDGLCPYRWYHRIRDAFRRWRMERAR